MQKTSWCYDLRQNVGLGIVIPNARLGCFRLRRSSCVLFCIGEEFASVFSSKFGPIDYIYGIKSASTDFVGVVP